MANAAKDQNDVSTLIGVLESDGATIMRVKANPTTHGIGVSDASTGNDNGPTGRALRDENDVTTICAVSETDGVTPVPIYVTSDGKLLIDSN